MESQSVYLKKAGVQSMSKSRDKIAGAVYGFAIGDAMGATTEFASSKQVKKIYGHVDDIIGGGWLHLKAGEVTDDTQMMICVMDAIMRAKGNTEAFKQRCGYNFVKWLAGKPKDIGSQCYKGIANIRDHGLLCMSPDKNALGNGSLMRALPCALIGNIDWNDAQGRMTHNNYICNDMITFYHNMIQIILNDQPFTRTSKEDKLKEPTGHVVNTLNNAEYWFWTSETFNEAIDGAVNDGGDADTIAALTGGLAGAYYGFDQIPEKWVQKLDKKVKKNLEKFIDFCCQTK